MRDSIGKSRRNLLICIWLTAGMIVLNLIILGKLSEISRAIGG